MKRHFRFPAVLIFVTCFITVGCPDDGPDDDEGVADAADRFFVDSVRGVDTNTGRRASPLKTIREGIERAEVEGGSVYVAGGIYEERVLLKSAVELRGGYESVEWTVDRENSPSTLMWDNAPVVGDGVTSALVEGFTIVTPHGTEDGESKLAVSLNESMDVRLRSLMLLPGDGAAGAAGVDGVDRGPAANGQDGSDAMGCGGSIAGGAGGRTVSGIPYVGGAGGSGNVGGGSNGADGVGETSTSYAAPGKGGVGGRVSEFGGNGTRGGSGQINGVNGAHGAPIGAFTIMFVAGTKADVARDHHIGLYQPSNGGRGTDGQNGGAGGGGGGGGGGLVFACGGSGGGGGGHGLGGTGGGGGQGGGASIGVFIRNSTGISISECVIETGNGGGGAVGGGNGHPSAGGKGGTGGAGFGLQGPGGTGGDGGSGAIGSVGGNGGGGPVLGIVHDAGSAPSQSGNSIVLGASGEGGQFSPTIPGGEDGMAAAVYEFVEAP